MVTGIDKFRAYFAGHEGKYAVIGGTACDLLFTEAGLTFRRTKDIDLVICVEVIDAEFGRQIAEFIAAGGYKTKQRSDGSRQFHRFIEPTDQNFPYMLEVFTRGIALELNDGDIVRIPAEEEAVSLSAILMNDDYFTALKDHIRVVQDVAVLDAVTLVPFKARAHLDLAERRERGDSNVDRKAVNKHRADVFRLIQLFITGDRCPLPQSLQHDMQRFIDKVAADPEFSTRDLETGFTVEQSLKILREVYLADLSGA